MVKAFRNGDKTDVIAIKKVKRVFEHTAFAHRAMRELRILRCLSGHENVSCYLICISESNIWPMIDRPSP